MGSGTSTRLPGASSPRSATPSPAALPSPQAADLAPDRVEVVSEADPVASAVNTSRLLFASSPGAVVASITLNPAGRKQAATTASAAHLPLLVAPAAGSPAVDEELRRLGATWYVAAGTVRVPPSLRAVNDPPPAGPLRAAVSPAVVLAPTGGSDTPALTTARGAGATVVPLPTGVTDPTTVPAAVTALHADAHRPVVLLGAGFGDLPDPSWSVRSAQTGWQLPGGGQRATTGHLSVALYGAPGSPALGVLGEQDPAATVARVRALAATYAALTPTPVVPTLEVIATVAAGNPGADGNYSNELPLSRLTPYLDAATDAGLPVLLDLQPGRTDFLTQAQRYTGLLERPGVGLALDPEWRLGPEQVPLHQIGGVDVDEVNRTVTWLADLVKAKGLPPKTLVVHQFRPSMVRDRSRLDVSRPELDVVIHVDGQGSQAAKQGTWKRMHEGAPDVAGWGWKNFLDEDSPVLTPQQTLTQVTPTPALVSYQ
ncbi:MAG: hypothetical protein ABI083_07085 [Lapillicoccus sp.]